MDAFTESRAGPVSGDLACADSRLAFGSWRFDPATGDLGNSHTEVRLEPRVARLLHYFLLHQGRLLSRDELVAEVWGGRIVSDHAINRCVSILRNTLSADNRNQYVETVVRRGYISHFPNIEVVDSGSTTAALTPPGRRASDRRSPVDRRGRVADRRHKAPTFNWRIVGLASLMVLILVVFLQRRDDGSVQSQSGAFPHRPVLAVLPFIPHDTSQESRLFASGVHDDLLTRLAQFPSMHIVSRTSVAEYTGRGMDLREIGQKLGADAVLEGGVQRAGDRIRIYVQLIDSRSDTHLWAQQYEHQLTATNALDIQAAVARSAATSLHSRLLAGIPGQGSQASRRN